MLRLVSLLSLLTRIVTLLGRLVAAGLLLLMARALFVLMGALIAWILLRTLLGIRHRLPSKGLWSL